MDISRSLHNNFGFPSFRTGQVQAIESLLAGCHTLVVMPTGAGKSLVFQLAALQLDGIALVVSPLIALMKDQVDSLTRRNIPATFINSALPASQQSLRLQNLSQNKYKLVYVAPERLRNVPFLNALKTQKVGLLAVDEAHCISEWGHDFRPDYLHIAQTRAALGNPLTAALTATATPQVQQDIVRLLGLGDATRVVTGFNRPNLALDVRYMSGLPSKLRALQELLPASQAGAAIIYTGTRRDAEEVTEFVREVAHLPAEFYHAGLLPEERTRIQNEFISGRLNVICATNAFGMGIDRADVRQVIHYSLPGSLEAYYQEAGRAGRDGLAAKVTLLYDPQDRSLHEFFIQQSELTAGDLRLIHNAIPGGEQTWITIDDISRLTGLHPVQIKVGLSGLERADGLEHLGDEGYRMLFRKGEWKPRAVENILLHSQEHIKHRLTQLAGIVHYAESNSCRRKIVLKHFGDAGEAEAADCCDNCRNARTDMGPGKEVSQMSHGERAALVILDCIRRAHIRVGREKLAQILHGSKARDILKFHHDKSAYYGSLAVVRQNDIEEMVGQLIEMGYLKVIGGEYPILHLTPRGENAIKQKEAIALKTPKSLETTEIRRAKAKLAAGGTLEYTAKLFAEGLKPEQIARERGFALTTIYGHFAQLIAASTLNVEQVVPADVREKIESAIQKVGSTQYLSPIKSKLPDDIDFNIIKCVVAGYDQPRSPAAQPDDSVESFLNKPHPRLLVGAWQSGWSLGFHSRITGADWSRSGVGDLTYRLKYESDTSVLPALVQQTLDLFRAHPDMCQADFIVPVPGSAERKVHPVHVFCEALAGKIGIPMQAVVAKSRPTQPQKEMKTLAQKRANVAEVFSVRGEITGKRILLVDDLFDSGATLDEITRLLHEQGAACVHVLTLTRTIHSDA